MQATLRIKGAPEAQVAHTTQVACSIQVLSRDSYLCVRSQVRANSVLLRRPHTKTQS